MTLIFLTGCSATTKYAVPERQLPAPPSFMGPVKTPVVREGQPAKAVAAQLAGTVKEANSRLAKSCEWYYLSVKGPMANQPYKPEEIKKICVVKR